ncbi:MAG: hypothetical protein JWN30_585, partial [Bacilli bacterium]|nr:hypothetical protein [Bacilli bacterium]
GGHIDLKQYGQIDSQGQNASRSVSIAEASQLMGHPIKPLPGTDPQNDRVSYASGSDIVFQLHTVPINTLLQRLGGKTTFPSTIDGRPFVFHVPPSVNLNNSNADQQHTSYNLQILKAPSLDVPAGVDIEQVRQALLDLPFLQGNARNSLLRTEDWKNTLFLPMGSGNTQNITLNGHEAVLNSGPGFGELMWLQDGYIYTLEAWTDSGQSGPPHSVPSTDNLISMAKEISG